MGKRIVVYAEYAYDRAPYTLRIIICSSICQCRWSVLTSLGDIMNKRARERVCMEHTGT